MAQVFATETSRTFFGLLDLFVAEVSGRDFILLVCGMYFRIACALSETSEYWL